MKCGVVMDRKLKKKKLIGLGAVLAIFCVLFVYCVHPVYGDEEPEQKVVRVGCVDIEQFLLMDKSGNVHGYGEEYLSAISKYTNWKYEYVQGSWKECLQWLKEGKIDLLFPAEYTEERAESFLYSDTQCCIDFVALLTRQDNQDLYYGDFENYDGIKVGMIINNHLNSIFKETAEERGFSYKPVYYESMGAMQTALKNKEIDAIVNGNLSIQEGQKLLLRTKSVPAYFITAKSSTELMSELNHALEKLDIENPYFVSNLTEKYYGDFSKHAKGLTREEANFAKNSEPIKVAVAPDTYPYQWYDEEEKKFKGVDLDVLNSISENTGLKFEYVETKDRKESWTYLEEGKVDMIAGIYSDNALERKYRLTLSKSYADKVNTAVTRKGNVVFPTDKLKVAIPESFRGLRTYIENNYPEWVMVTAKDEEACLRLVRGGKADITFINSLRIHSDVNYSTSNDVDIVSSITMNVPIYMGISDGQSTLLISLLDKGISMMDSNDVDDYKIFNSIRQNQYSLTDLIRANPFAAVTAAIFLMTLLFAAVFLTYKNRQKAAYAKILESNNCQLQEANNAKSEFLQRVSHDMRTPMNGIIGLTTLSLEKNHVQGELRENLEQIHNSSMYLLNLINDTLDMSQIEEKKMNLQEDILSLGTVVDTVASQIGVMAKSKKLDFVCATEIENECLYGDKIRIEQILINLLSNAVKFTPAGGKVALHVRSRNDDKERRQVEFLITDTGIGIGEEFLSKIYDPFEQEYGNIVDKIGGTGLGMSIVKNLVDMMGGTIDIKSEKGRGTRISVTLSFRIAEQKVSETEASSHSREADFDRLKDKRILLCEDHKINRQIACKILENAGCRVDTAEDGKLCLEKFAGSEEFFYDCILMDIRMPVMDGLTAAREIRRLDRSDAKTVSIVAMTANAFDEDVKKSLDAGMNAHISKPIDKEVLYSAILKDYYSGE